MTDRELLELAAKVAGVDLLWLPDGTTTNAGRNIWNPLADDGDALRLAVKLGISNDPCRFFGLIDSNFVSGKRNSSDPYAATRRAIVRAAAEIGKEMKG